MTNMADEYSKWFEDYQPGVRVVELMTELEDLEWKIPISYFKGFQAALNLILDYEDILKAFEDWNGVCLVDRALEVFKEIYKDHLVLVISNKEKTGDFDIKSWQEE